MRRIAFSLAVVTCVLVSAWFITQPAIEPAAASVLANSSAVTGESAAPQTAAVQLAATPAETAAPSIGPAPLSLASPAPAAQLIAASTGQPEQAAAVEAQVNSALTARIRRDGGCPGAPEAIGEISRAIAGVDVATASLALANIDTQSQACAGVAAALERSRAAARHSAGWSIRSNAVSSPSPVGSGEEGGGLPGGEGGPGYRG